MGFLKISMSVHTWLAAETHLTDGGFLQVAVNRGEFKKLRDRTRIPVVSKRDGQHFKPEYTEINDNNSSSSYYYYTDNLNWHLVLMCRIRT